MFDLLHINSEEYKIVEQAHWEDDIRRGRITPLQSFMDRVGDERELCNPYRCEVCDPFNGPRGDSGAAGEDGFYE